MRLLSDAKRILPDVCVDAHDIRPSVLSLPRIICAHCSQHTSMKKSDSEEYAYRPTSRVSDVAIDGVAHDAVHHGREQSLIRLAVVGIHRVAQVDPVVGDEEGVQHNGEQTLVSSVMHFVDEVDEGRGEERAVFPDADGSLLESWQPMLAGG